MHLVEGITLLNNDLSEYIQFACLWVPYLHEKQASYMWINETWILSSIIILSMDTKHWLLAFAVKTIFLILTNL